MEKIKLLEDYHNEQIQRAKQAYERWWEWQAAIDDEFGRYLAPYPSANPYPPTWELLVELNQDEALKWLQMEHVTYNVAYEEGQQYAAWVYTVNPGLWDARAKRLQDEPQTWNVWQ